MAVDVVAFIDVSGGHEAHQPSAAMPCGCSAMGPSASVVITAPTEEELEQAKTAIAPLLTKVVGDLRLDGLFLPT